jgi:serine/threonine protein kinase
MDSNTHGLCADGTHLFVGRVVVWSQEVMNIFCQLCLGLRHVHSHKILHRDLKVPPYSLHLPHLFYITSRQAQGVRALN